MTYDVVDLVGRADRLGLLSPRGRDRLLRNLLEHHDPAVAGAARRALNEVRQAEAQGHEADDRRSCA